MSYPICWEEVGKRKLWGPEMVQLTTNKVRVIRKRMKEARKKERGGYADNRKRPLEFQMGDKVFLKVAPWKGIIRFGEKGKLAPRYILALLRLRKESNKLPTVRVACIFG
jgi:hypothetical protein